MFHWTQPSPRCTQWLNNYQMDHRHPTNHVIHCFGIPLIYISLMGLLNLLLWKGYGLGNIGLLGVVLFYVIHDTKASLILIPCMLLGSWISSHLTWTVSAAIFMLSWIAQILGHRIYDQNNPSTYKSLVYLLVAPLYLIDPWIWDRPSRSTS
ncbi:MAG: Mpo1-like protein [Holophagaceae bacterium]